VSVPYRKRIGESKISGTLSGTVCAGTKIILTIFRHRFLRAGFGCGRRSERPETPPPRFSHVKENISSGAPKDE
jgi:hypothetical protein